MEMENVRIVPALELSVVVRDLVEAFYGRGGTDLDLRVIPVEVIRLAPRWPQGVPLPMTVGQTVRSILWQSCHRGVGGSTSTGCPPPWAPGADRLPEWELAWKQFARAASYWDGNLHERKGHLDPEAYAIELDQATSGALSIRDDWRQFVSAVVQEARRSLRLSDGIHHDAKIIVPIEGATQADVDTIVRVLSHPDVVYLIALDEVSAAVGHMGWNPETIFST